MKSVYVLLKFHLVRPVAGTRLDPSTDIRNESRLIEQCCRCYTVLVPVGKYLLSTTHNNINLIFVANRSFGNVPTSWVLTKLPQYPSNPYGMVLVNSYSLSCTITGMPKCVIPCELCSKNDSNCEFTLALTSPSSTKREPLPNILPSKCNSLAKEWCASNHVMLAFSIHTRFVGLRVGIMDKISMNVDGDWYG